MAQLMTPSDAMMAAIFGPLMLAAIVFGVVQVTGLHHLAALFFRRIRRGLA